MKRLVKAPLWTFAWVLLVAATQCQPVKEKTLAFHNFQEGFHKKQGRTFLTPEGGLHLISAASQVVFEASGKEVKIPLRSLDEERAYVSVFKDGMEVDRFLVQKKDTTFITVELGASSIIELVKDSEASTGTILVDGVWAESLGEKPVDNKLFIEFIGNSITSAMGADTTDLPCGEGRWYDQHRASFSYGTQVADSLNVDFTLNSVSGYGIYRNWNDENIEQPTLPQVYNNLYLNRDSTSKYEPKRTPDLISICLGTNDLSAGDGVKPRLPFNTQKYVDTYIGFVQELYDRSPKAKVVLLTSPMVNGDNAKTLKDALDQVAAAFTTDYQIKVFEFAPITPTGCGYHPLIPEQKEMARQLTPVYRELLGL